MEKRKIPNCLTAILFGIHEKEGEWLDHCKTLKVKDVDGKVIGRIRDLTPVPEGLKVTAEIFDYKIYEKIIERGCIEFTNTCKNPHFRLFMEDNAAQIP